MSKTKNNHIAGQEHINPGMGETSRDLDHIEIDLIDVVANPRTETNEEHFSSLCESVKRFGVMTPITVARTEDDDRYTVIAGGRRFLAAKEVGLTLIPAQITSHDEVATTADRLSRAMVENLVRENMTPVDEAVAFATLQQAEGLNEQGVAELLSISTEKVKDRLALLTLPASVQEKVDRAEITLQNAATLKPIAKQSPRVAEALAERVVTGSQSPRALDDDPAAALRALADVEIAPGDTDEDLFVLPFGERDSVNVNEVISRLERVIGADVINDDEKRERMEKSITSAKERVAEIDVELAVVSVAESEVDRARSWGGLIEYTQGAHKRSGVLTDPEFAADWVETVVRTEFGALTPEQLKEKDKAAVEGEVDAIQNEKKRREEEKVAADRSNGYLGDKLKGNLEYKSDLTMEMAVTLCGLVMDTYGREIARTIGIVRDDFMVVDNARSMSGGKKRVTTRLPGPDEALEKMEEILSSATTPQELMSRTFGFVSAAVFADRRSLPESRRGNRFPLPISTGNKDTIPGQVRGALWDAVAPMLTKERAEELEESFAPSDEGRPTRDRLAREDDIDLESAATDQQFVGDDDLGIEGLDLTLDEEEAPSNGIDLDELGEDDEADDGTPDADTDVEENETDSTQDTQEKGPAIHDVPFPDPEPVEVG